MAQNRKTPNGFDAASFDFSGLNESLREIAEKSMTQTVEACDKFRAGAEEITRNAQASMDSMRDGATQLAARAIENAKANADASIEFIGELSNARTLAEALELQGRFFRASCGNLSSQMKEARELSVRLGEEAFASASESVSAASAASSASTASAPASDGKAVA